MLSESIKKLSAECYPKSLLILKDALNYFINHDSR